ncbi:hypothetical protein GOZ78_16555 [Agrobacterium vitis]|uniref:Uncharacterized protein n=1 Tax=Agrobacterium vitis TaxID=373 RepID=A0ABD6G965_AGRVI|nr:hypothetical protein [Agrobacterium vitis]MUO79202.1 hypothetical protein [Agrobacterium vitis]MUO95520.1 hypothetical protein [Agrobacterium vitis]MUP05910.1 hypothetical protein [Agrobacterium vitis]MUZ82994.1 hypothetical protein [Agrobacterium vitis]MVA11632.1 hypothetical protein [Agrobacterium vitis]
MLTDQPAHACDTAETARLHSVLSPFDLLLETLDQELTRLARVKGVEAVVYGDGWLSS